MNPGLAVSGGADSMALAYLCRQLEIHSGSIADDAISVTAFVVDHRARAESSREAKTVAGWLSDLGITSELHVAYFWVY
jgi:tRNA(Ile)-lysidine synthase TilS/MesJ